MSSGPGYFNYILARSLIDQRPPYSRPSATFVAGMNFFAGRRNSKSLLKNYHQYNALKYGCYMRQGSPRRRSPIGLAQAALSIRRVLNPLHRSRD